MTGSGLIPRTFIDDLVSRLDIVDLIDSYVPLKRAGRSFIACCPFHQEKSPSFNVSQSKQFYHCFGCGVSGNAISFIMAYRNLAFPEAIEELAARAGLEVPYENPKNPNAVKYLKNAEDLYTLLSRIAHYYQEQLYCSPQAEHAREYVKKRGLSDNIVKEYQLGYAPDGWNNLEVAFPKTEKALITTGMLIQKSQGRPYDQYRDRLMFPIHDRRGRIIGFGGRVLDDKLPKYINSPETTLFHKSKSLYGLYQVAQRNQQNQQQEATYILVVEGYMDVIALAQNGISNVVAALGTATTRDHIQSLLRYTKRFVFCFDGDKAGRKAAWKALESALPFLDKQALFQFMFLPEGEDPDTFVRLEGKEVFEQRVYEAKSLDVFFFDELIHSLDLSGMADRSKLVEMAKPYFALMPSCAYQDLMLEQLARFARMSLDSLQKQVQGKKVLENQVSYVSHSYNTPKSTPQKMNRTNARIALALLIQHPELIKQIEKTSTTDLTHLARSKGGKMLYDIILALKQESIYSTGVLLEYYRNHEYFSWITQLAIFSHGVPLEGIAEEFLGAIQNMQKEQKDKEIRAMLEQKTPADFSDVDRRALFEKIRKNKTKEK